MDLLLIHAHETSDPDRLARAIQATFERRATHLVPAALPSPPRELAVSYRRDASPVGVAATLDDAHRELASWIDPILQRLRP